MLIRVGIVSLLSLLSLNTFSKRYIVHYKPHSLALGSLDSKVASKSIVEASSPQEARDVFPLGPGSIVEIEEDYLLQHTIEPGDVGREDAFYQQQWHYFDSDGGIELPAAWGITTGSSDIVVAIVDTGIIAHSDLDGKILAGADVISDPNISIDGDGRDNDPSDTGDWVEAGDICYTGFKRDSSWHGTHVAGTIAAKTANLLGVAGVSWGAKILPVRVLGKCGGYISDIADGIVWAAGGGVSGLPINSNPAHVINLSLGGPGSCGTTMQNAIDFARSKGSVVVVAAGNDSSNLNYSNYTPATCRGVITVGAGNRFAMKSSYSNYGDFVDVMAPGGDFNGTIFSTSNDGIQGQGKDSYKGMMGTSMAAPHVSGVVALILGHKPGLFPNQVEYILKQTTKFFSCSSGDCGAGLINAFAALEFAAGVDPDGSFPATEPEGSADTSVSARESLTVYEDDSGGMCGSVSFIDGNGKPPTGGGGAFRFIFTLLMGCFLGFFTKKRRKAVSRY
jgi:serine protease